MASFKMSDEISQIWAVLDVLTGYTVAPVITPKQLISWLSWFGHNDVTYYYILKHGHAFGQK